MIIFYGYKNDSKKVAYAGLEYCTHCNNISNFYLNENSFKPTLFFVPVAKFTTKRFVACETCSYGFEVDSQKASQIKEDSQKIPSLENTIEALNKIHAAIMKEPKLLFMLTDDNIKNKKSTITKEIIERTNLQMSADDIFYVYTRLVASVARNLKSKEK
jgi:hypothetical protein